MVQPRRRRRSNPAPHRRAAVTNGVEAIPISEENRLVLIIAVAAGIGGWFMCVRPRPRRMSPSPRSKARKSPYGTCAARSCW